MVPRKFRCGAIETLKSGVGLRILGVAPKVGEKGVALRVGEKRGS